MFRCIQWPMSPAPTRVPETKHLRDLSRILDHVSLTVSIPNCSSATWERSTVDETLWELGIEGFETAMQLPQTTGRPLSKTTRGGLHKATGSEDFRARAVSRASLGWIEDAAARPSGVKRRVRCSIRPQNSGRPPPLAGAATSHAGGISA